MSAATKNLNPPGPMIVSRKIKTIYSILMLLGAMGIIFGAVTSPVREWHAYLVSLFYFVSLALGGVFFASLQHVTKAGWSVTIRRFCESLTAFLPYAAGAAVVFVVLGSRYTYEWLNSSLVAQDEILQHKSAYLNGPFFWVRLALFFGVWIFFSRLLVGYSTQQDKTGDERLTVCLMKPSIVFLLLFALSYSLFSVDLLMSLDPHWFSTIFGVYCFAGLFQATMAAIILITIYFIKIGKVTNYVNEDHLHDLGKFMMAFTLFWAYIAFSQYMLMWYANLPEETTFFIPRSEGPWVLVSLALIIFKFVVPFVSLLPRWVKRSTSHLVVLSCLILVMEYVDLYWLAYPSMNEHEVVFGLPEILTFLGFLGLFLFSITRFLSKNEVVAIKDPRLQEALHHHVIY